MPQSVLANRSHPRQVALCLTALGLGRASPCLLLSTCPQVLCSSPSQAPVWLWPSKQTVSLTCQHCCHRQPGCAEGGGQHGSVQMVTAGCTACTPARFVSMLGTRPVAAGIHPGEPVVPGLSGEAVRRQGGQEGRGRCVLTVSLWSLPQGVSLACSVLGTYSHLHRSTEEGNNGMWNHSASCLGTRLGTLTQYAPICCAFLRPLGDAPFRSPNLRVFVVPTCERPCWARPGAQRPCRERRPIAPMSFSRRLESSLDRL